MSTAMPLSRLAVSGRWQNDFVNLVPQIQKHAEIRFRHLPATEQEEAIAEALAVACVNYAGLAHHGKLDVAFPSSLANFAVRHVALNRHVGGRQNSKDALSPLAQKRRGFTVLSFETRNPPGWEATVMENHRTSPADLAAFRVDFRSWLKGFTRRQRRVINRLVAGDKPGEVASKVRLSRGRISQLRREFERSWKAFQGEAAEMPDAA